MKRFFNWLANKVSPQKDSPRPDLTQSGQHVAPGKVKVKQAVPQQQPEYIDFDADLDDQNDDRKRGNKALLRNKYVREDTGTHETFTILDDSAIDTNEEEGIDPYNTGQFDRSRNWDKRFRKD